MIRFTSLLAAPPLFLCVQKTKLPFLDRIELVACWGGVGSLEVEWTLLFLGKGVWLPSYPVCHGDEKAKGAILLSTTEPEAKSSLLSSWLTNRGNKLPRH